ncbi:MAG: hypothetical protein WBX25_07345 [Rhodomicrobium sp.]
MVRSIKWRALYCALTLFAVLPLTRSHAAQQDAIEGEQQTQSDADARSYLPPWMQDGQMQNVQPTENKDAGLAGKPVTPIDAQEAAKKAKAAQQKRNRNSFHFLTSLFGR